MSDAATKSVEVLILGAGWTSQFLIPQLKEVSISYAATTTTGHDDTIPFRFDPSSEDTEPYKKLPSASTVLITFPLTGTGQSKHITSLYRSVHGDKNNWIQLGSTGIFKNETWNDENAPYDNSNPRAIAEDELIESANGCVLNLAGLYGGERQPKNWLTRVAKSKEQLKAKGAVHLIHGEDVSRAIIAVHMKFTPRKRWIVADLRSYDWWLLALDWSSSNEYKLEDGTKLEFSKWVGELMVEEDVKALPRDSTLLGRLLDARNFWNTVGIWPSRAINS